MRLLIVEDDPMVGDALQKSLKQSGFTADWVQDGSAANIALRHETYALLLLDLGLPGQSGLAILEALRQRGDTLPIFIITARDRVADRIHALNMGADDYLIKPFDFGELEARIHALLRRQHGQASSQLSHGSLTLDAIHHHVTFLGKPVQLSAKEFTLLQTLMLRPTAVLSAAQLEQALYAWNEEVVSNAIEVHIHHLRRKLCKQVIINIRGVGYRLGLADALDS